MTYQINYSSVNDIIEQNDLNVNDLQRFIMEYEPNASELVHGIIGYLRIVAPEAVRYIYTISRHWQYQNVDIQHATPWEVHKLADDEMYIDLYNKLVHCVIGRSWLEVNIDKLIKINPRQAARLPDYAIGMSYICLYEDTGLQLYRSIPYQIWCHIYIWLKKNHWDRVTNY